MSNYNPKANNSSDTTDEDLENIRSIPLYGALVCAILIIIVGLFLVFRKEVASGNLPAGRGMGTGKFGIIPGPVAIGLGILIAVVPIYYLIEIRQKRSKGQ